MVGVGAALAVLVLLVLQATTTTGLFGTRTVTTTYPPVVDQVGEAYANHLLLFGSKNISALTEEYEPNATLYIEGVSDMLAGNNFTGRASVIQYLTAFLMGTAARNSSGAIVGYATVYFLVANETEPVIRTIAIGDEPSSALVNSTFGFRGFSQIYGDFNGTMSDQSTFVRGANGGWLISNETWNIRSYWQQVTIIA